MPTTPLSAVDPTLTDPPAPVRDDAPQRLVRTVRDEDRKQPHPLYCVWEITLQCDLGCKHCGSRAGPKRPDELTTAECLGVVDQLAELKVRELTLIGGEAYLREDWDQIARHASNKGLSVGITTGAKNLTDERIARAVDAGIRTISISLDGLQRTHDAVRGVVGSHASALRAAEAVSKTRIRLANNTQINRLSLPELPAMAQMLADVGCKAWQIQLTVPMGHGADRPELLLQPWELLELYPLLVWIKQERLDPNQIGLFPGNNIGYFGPYESLLRYGGDKGAHWQGCSAGKWTLGLEADGKIKGCPSLPSDTYTGGNIRERSILDAIRNAPEIYATQFRTRDDLWGYCQTCYYADVCKAGCTWTSHVLLGKPGNNPYCIHRAMQHEADGLRERLYLAEVAPGLPFDNGRYGLVTEPLPPLAEGAEETILGWPLQQVLQLDWRSGGIWSDAAMYEILLGKSRKEGRQRVEALGIHRRAVGS